MIVIDNVKLIAPCGMNCSLCFGYLREKNKCLGCNATNQGKPISCVKCRIKNCDYIKDHEFCIGCPKFPCLRLKQLDKRYRTKYNMSMLDNLKEIKELGINQFIINQKKIWTCKSCGGMICVHRGYCLTCHK